MLNKECVDYYYYAEPEQVTHSLARADAFLVRGLHLAKGTAYENAWPGPGDSNWARWPQLSRVQIRC